MLKPYKSVKISSGIKQFSKFLVVGFSNFAISFAVYYFLYKYMDLSGVLYGLLGESGKGLEGYIQQLGATSLNASLANIFGYGAGIINSFIWNKYWTFQVKRVIAVQFRRFLAINFFCLVLSSASLFLFTDYLGWSYLLVWFITMGTITMINFVASKFWVFENTWGQSKGSL
jgi:putative flippase GtrA